MVYAIILLAIFGYFIEFMEKIAPYIVRFIVELTPIFVLFMIILCCLKIYAYFYFKGKSFLKIKKKIEKNTLECNELNVHIQDLKKSSLDIFKIDYGQADYYDESIFNYKRKNKNLIGKDKFVYDCSLTVCKNAQTQPFKYLCKYFNIKADEKNLEKFEQVFNNYSAVEQGKLLLVKERDEIINGLNKEIPFVIFKFFRKKLIIKLGFYPIEFNDIYYPIYTFRYISPAGNITTKCDIKLDVENLEKFIVFLAEIVKFKKSAAGQRALMTSKLREKIKIRDHYTCCKCSLSTQKEPNLLLEIDHVIPVSKGGMTTEKNLQTLCWKCNRTKSDKIE